MENCEGYEHFNCANIHENQRKEICLNGSKEYLCTECLTKYPTLALELTSIDPVDDILDKAQEDTTEAIIEEVKTTEEQSQSELQCQTCSLEIKL